MPSTIPAALQLTLIDMAVVFAVLAFLIVVIQATRSLITRANGRAHDSGEREEDEGWHEIVDLVSRTAPETQQKPEPGGEAAVGSMETVQAQPASVEPTGVPGEVIAAISAALHTYMGSAAPVQIKSITPLPGVAVDAWLVAGRGRLMRTGLGPRHRRSKSWRDVSE